MDWREILSISPSCDSLVTTIPETQHQEDILSPSCDSSVTTIPETQHQEDIPGSLNDTSTPIDMEIGTEHNIGTENNPGEINV